MPRLSFSRDEGIGGPCARLFVWSGMPAREPDRAVPTGAFIASVQIAWANDFMKEFS